MFKKIIKIWKSFIGSNNPAPTLSPEEAAQGRLFIHKCFVNEEYQAIGRAYKLDPVKYKIPKEVLDFLENNLKQEFENNKYVSPTVEFFSNNPQLLSTDSFFQLFKNNSNSSDQFGNELIRQNILAKNPDLIKVDKLSEKDFALKRTCDFIISKSLSKEVQQPLIQKFTQFLKHGSIFPLEEKIFCLAAPNLVNYFKYSDIQKSPHTSNLLNRTFFAEFRQLAEAKNTQERLTQKETTKNTEEDKPFVLDNKTLSLLPNNIRKKYDNIITMVNKYKNSRIPNDTEDSYFLEQLVEKHLPETIFQYLQVDPAFRDQVFKITPKTATELIDDTFDIYITRLDKIALHLSEVALNKLNANKLLIQRMSQNINLYNQGIIEVPDELEIQAPDVHRPLVSMRKP